MIHLALVDDHIITRKGIKTLIEKNGDIKVILEASSGKELLEILLLAQNLPDIIILDINMPEMNGHDTVKALQSKYPFIKIIIFSLIYEEDTVINMISSGACAYISKNADPSNLEKAIITVQTKGFYLSDLVKKEYFRKYGSSKKKSGFSGKQYISLKEIEFIKLSASNHNYKEIAEIMEVSPKTVENYRDSLFQKLEIKNRAALVLYGLKNGLIDTFLE